MKNILKNTKLFGLGICALLLIGQNRANASVDAPAKADSCFITIADGILTTSNGKTFDVKNGDISVIDNIVKQNNISDTVACQDVDIEIDGGNKFIIINNNGKPTIVFPKPAEKTQPKKQIRQNLFADHRNLAYSLKENAGRQK